MTEPIDQATKDLIEKEAMEMYPNRANNGMVFPEYNAKERFAYIQGAAVWAEKLKQERNKAIQSCIEVLINDDRIHFNASDWLEKLESLKDKSHE